MDVLEKYTTEHGLDRMLLGKQKISVRFRNINIAFLLLTSLAMFLASLLALKEVVRTISVDYARLYTSNTAGSLSVYLNRGIRLMARAAHSSAVMDWFADEDDHEKKIRAHEEMRGIMGALYGRNLYIGLEKTLNEYAVEGNFAVDDLKPKAKLDPGRYENAWYFECLLSNEDYVLNVDTDKIAHRNRVWLNYKVSRNGVPLGVISSGLDFSQAAVKFFSEYDNKKVRVLIIDEGGTVHMDSDLLGQDAFLAPESEVLIEEMSSDPGFLAAIKTHLVSTPGYFEFRAKPRAIELPTGPYSYVSIAPIASTNWSVVTFFESSYLFDWTKLLPFFVIITVLFILFVLVTNMFSRELIFVPFEQLIRSLVRVKENDKELIYGTDRDDEFGILSNTIQDLFIKANHDQLTGLYNRRFLEKNLQRSIESISRYGGVLSVLMIDVDFFKKYNDKYGHGVGDECLRSIAEALEGGTMRADDFVARYGGEEFVAVLPNADEHGARLVAERLLKKVRGLKILHEENDSGSGWVTVSIGITSSRAAHTQNGQNYLKRADEAMYMAKQKGRNQCFFLPFQEGSTD